MLDEIQVGPLIFQKGRGSEMYICTEDEVLGMCEGVFDETWAEFVKAVVQEQA